MASTIVVTVQGQDGNEFDISISVGFFTTGAWTANAGIAALNQLTEGNYGWEGEETSIDSIAGDSLVKLDSLNPKAPAEVNDGAWHTAVLEVTEPGSAASPAAQLLRRASV